MLSDTLGVWCIIFKYNQYNSEKNIILSIPMCKVDTKIFIITYVYA